MEMKRMLYVTGLLLCTSLGGYAQEGNLIDVKVVNEEVKKQGSEVSLRMTLDLTGLRVGNQKSVCLHPAVVSADGTHEAVLAPVVVDGKTRSRVHRREKALTGASPATDNAYTVLRSGRESRVEYIAKLAYEPWMVDSRLVLRERMTGCLDCTAATEESTVKAPFIKLFTPRYVTPFVTPEREAVKVRNEVRVARLQFRQGKSDVDPRYKDNRAELETVTGSINVVKTNPDLTITGIYITGYASPEGSVAFNQKLSESRANALAEYARKDTHMDASLWHVAGMGEDWEGLRREVEKHPQLLDIDKVLRLIDECEGDKDACEKRIRESVSPDVYTRLLNEMYGPLRRNEYKIEYSVRSFNLEEAKKQIKTRPDLLSVEEIYTVAESYGCRYLSQERRRCGECRLPEDGGQRRAGSYRDAGGFGGERGRQGAERAGCGVCQAEAVRPCKGGAGASSAGRKPGSTHQPGAGGRRSGRLVRKTEQIHKTNIFY